MQIQFHKTFQKQYKNLSAKQKKSVDDYDGAVYSKDQVGDILRAKKRVNCKNLSLKYDNTRDAVSYLHSA